MSSSNKLGYRFLYREYVMAVKSVAEIAEETNKTHYEVSTALHAFGIPVRSRGRRSKVILKSRRAGAGR